MKARLAAAAVLFALAVTAGAAEPGKLQVYILAGQSNMEGKAKVSLLDYQATQRATKAIYEPLRKDGKWIERDDVWIKFLDRKGKLTVGYGSPKCIGPELGFGTAMGDHHQEPVLLIKTAWGGRSLYRDFRPPSAGLPAEAVLEKMLADQQKRQPKTTMDDVKKAFGASYRAMIEDVKATLADPKAVYPDYDGKGYEIAGFVWFQGWNDMINPEYTAEYTKNLTHFVRDVRKDLGVPNLPFVVGVMGVDGTDANAKQKEFRAAQAAVADVPEFKGNVAVVQTDVFWDTDAAAVFKKGWKQNLEEWNKVGSDYPFHYLGSGKTHLGMGKAFAEAVLKLRGEKRSAQ